MQHQRHLDPALAEALRVLLWAAARYAVELSAIQAMQPSPDREKR